MKSIITAVFILFASITNAQTVDLSGTIRQAEQANAEQKAREYCFSGRYQYLCHELLNRLSPSERARAKDASIEYAKQLCASGNYPYACRGHIEKHNQMFPEAKIIGPSDAPIPGTSAGGGGGCGSRGGPGYRRPDGKCASWN